MFRPNNIAFAVMLAAAWAGCSNEKPSSGGYVARVGDATLTQADLDAMQGGQPEHLTRQFITSWVTSELLYQEALREGIPQSGEVQRQIEDAKRQLAINALLRKEVYDDDSTAVDDSTLQEEFKRNGDAYRLRDDVVKMSFAIFDERDAANGFRSKILRGATWNDALQTTEHSPDLNAHLLRVATNQYFTQAMLYPEELWKIARTLNKEDVSYAVKTNAGYCIALVHDLRRQGELPDFGYVRDELRQRVLLKRRDEKYGKLLERLRSRYTVDVHLASGDSSAERTQ